MLRIATFESITLADPVVLGWILKVDFHSAVTDTFYPFLKCLNAVLHYFTVKAGFNFQGEKESMHIFFTACVTNMVVVGGILEY